VAAEYRKARGMNRLKRHGFTYRIASRPALTDWTCEEIDVVAPVTSISGPSYPVPTNWLARQAHRAVIRLRRLMG
jgi:hypothetical protein